MIHYSFATRDARGTGTGHSHYWYETQDPNTYAQMTDL